MVEPPSPAHSHSSSTPAYSNLPSPLLVSTQLMPPPAVNRELKPRRKLSDSHSISSNPEPPSPRNTGPSVDRKLKPPTPLQVCSFICNCQIKNVLSPLVPIRDKGGGFRGVLTEQFDPKWRTLQVYLEKHTETLLSIIQNIYTEK